MLGGLLVSMRRAHNWARDQMHSQRRMRHRGAENGMMRGLLVAFLPERRASEGLFLDLLLVAALAVTYPPGL